MTRDHRRTQVWALAAVTVALSVSVGTTYSQRTQFFPDSSYYAARALTIAGRSAADADRATVRFFREQGQPVPEEPLHQPNYRLYKPRILYPLLSAPFVPAFGLRGMRVVPLASVAALAFLLWSYARRRVSPWAAAAVAIAVINSRAFAVYGLAALTDSLALLLIVLAVREWPVRGRSSAWRVAAFTLAAGLTRDAPLYLLSASAAGALWARMHGDAGSRADWRRTLGAVAPAAIAGLAFIALVGRTGVFRQLHYLSGRADLGGAFEALPQLLGHALAGTASALVRDWPLLLVFVVALGSAVRNHESEEAWLGAGALAAAAVLLVLNPTSTKFRLQLPLVPFAVGLAALELGHRERVRRG
jgi:hypothetical protein